MHLLIFQYDYKKIKNYMISLYAIFIGKFCFEDQPYKPKDGRIKSRFHFKSDPSGQFYTLTGQKLVENIIHCLAKVSFDIISKQFHFLIFLVIAKQTENTKMKTSEQVIKLHSLTFNMLF